jgi:hypothetical protein
MKTYKVVTLSCCFFRNIQLFLKEEVAAGKKTEDCVDDEEVWIIKLSP